MIIYVCLIILLHPVNSYTNGAGSDIGLKSAQVFDKTARAVAPTFATASKEIGVHAAQTFHETTNTRNASKNCSS